MIENGPYRKRFEEALFGEDFAPLTYHNSDDKLVALDIAVVDNDKSYVLSIATYEHYARRSEGEEIGEEENDDVYVVVADEILPSDLLKIRAGIALDDNVRACLVEQK